jgi:hypothetical protein
LDTDTEDARAVPAAEPPRDPPGPVFPPEIDNRPPALSDLQSLPKVGNYPLLKLPPFDISLGASRAPVELANIFARDLDQCDLGLDGSEMLLGASARFEAKLQENPEDGKRVWEIVERLPNVGLAPTIATFTLSNDRLTFAWSSSQPPGTHGHMLPHCLLLVTAGDSRELCALGQPRQVDPIALNLDYGKHAHAISLGSSEQQEIPLGTDPRIRLELRVEGPGDLPVVVAPDEPLPVPSGTTVVVGPRAGDSKRDSVEFRVTFDRTNGRLQLSFENFWFPHYIADGDTRFDVNALPWKFVSYEHKEGKRFKRDDIRSFRGEASGFRNKRKGDAHIPKREIDAHTKAINIRTGQITKLDMVNRAARAEIARHPDEKLAPPEAHRAQRESEQAIKGLTKLNQDSNLAISLWTTSQAAHDHATGFIEGNLKWCDDIAKLLDRIQSEVRIGYRVYVVLDGGGEIELVSTRPAGEVRQGAPPLQLGLPEAPPLLTGTDMD